MEENIAMPESKKNLINKGVLLNTNQSLMFYLSEINIFDKSYV
jgi:hypothetical protein